MDAFIPPNSSKNSKQNLQQLFASAIHNWDMTLPGRRDANIQTATFCKFHVSPWGFIKEIFFPLGKINLPRVTLELMEIPWICRLLLRQYMNYDFVKWNICIRIVMLKMALNQKFRYVNWYHMIHIISLIWWYKWLIRWLIWYHIIWITLKTLMISSFIVNQLQKISKLIIKLSKRPMK